MAETGPGEGRTLLAGPTNVGKTRRTYAAIGEWVGRRGSDGVVVFEFAPELERDGRLIGGRLTRFGPLPDDLWEGVLEAHAPRATADDRSGAVRLAAENALGAGRLVAAAEREVPDPRAVFVNDATIAFGHPDAALERALDYWGRAERVVVNAFSGDELGTDDPVSRAERAALDRLRSWADETVRLD